MGRRKCLTIGSLNLPLLIFLVCQISSGIACSSSKSPGTLILHYGCTIISTFVLSFVSLHHIYIKSKHILDTSNSTEPEVASPTTTEESKATIVGKAEESQQIQRMRVMMAKPANAISLII